MKHKLFLIILLFGFLSCLKEDDVRNDTGILETATRGYRYNGEMPEIIGSRDGTYYPLFYTKSVSSDTWVIQSTQRKQVANNIAKVDSVSLVKIGTSQVGINNIVHYPYSVTVYYKDGTASALATYLCAINVSSLTYIPNASFSLLDKSNTAKWVSITQTVQQKKYGDFYFGKNKSKFVYNIETSNGLLFQDEINSNYSNGTVFTMNHS